MSDTKIDPTMFPSLQSPLHEFIVGRGAYYNKLDLVVGEELLRRLVMSSLREVDHAVAPTRPRRCIRGRRGSL